MEEGGAHGEASKQGAWITILEEQISGSGATIGQRRETVFWVKNCVGPSRVFVSPESKNKIGLSETWPSRIGPTRTWQFQDSEHSCRSRPQWSGPLASYHQPKTFSALIFPGTQHFLLCVWKPSPPILNQITRPRMQQKPQKGRNEQESLESRRDTHSTNTPHPVSNNTENLLPLTSFNFKTHANFDFFSLLITRNYPARAWRAQKTSVGHRKNIKSGATPCGQ